MESQPDYKFLRLIAASYGSFDTKKRLHAIADRMEAVEKGRNHKRQREPAMLCVGGPRAGETATITGTGLPDGYERYEVRGGAVWRWRPDDGNWR